MKRREVLTSLASLPVLGLFAYGLLRKRGVENRMYADIPGLEFLGERNIPVVKNADAGELRIGIIGFGGRGHYLARALGFAHPDWIKAAREKKQLNSHDMTYDFFMEQENLNVRITGICDVYEPNAESGVVVSHSKEGPGGSIPDLKPARRYAHYHEMLASDDIDAVIIATPDHWHATMAMDAARAGKRAKATALSPAGAPSASASASTAARRPCSVASGHNIYLRKSLEIGKIFKHYPLKSG